MNWRDAFFSQARSDYQMFEHLEGLPDIAYCHRLHYLQMATEKLAKGFSARNKPATDSNRPPKDHDAFRNFIRTAPYNPELKRLLGMKNKDSTKNYLNSLVSAAKQIEDLSPDGIDHPNPEYPWLDSRGQLCSPLTHEFPELKAPKNIQMAKLLGFINDLFDSDLTSTQQDG